ncbi:MAG TPA: STAS domain-containing protein [Gaiellaceae bacterium]|nr:STAS domain-containing protein [Gaiellaceae bacterium]
MRENGILTGEFRIDEEAPRAGTAVLVVHGEADLHVAPDLRDRLATVIDSGVRALVVDLSDTTFLDSMTLGVLLGGLKRIRARNGQLRLVAPRPEIRRIFEITLLDRIFPLDETRAAALAALEDGVDAG